MPTLTLQIRSGEDTRLGERPHDKPIGANVLTFDEVVRQHQPQVARLAHRLLGWRDRDAVEDVVQEVFLVALRRRLDFRGESALSTWLMGITVNQCRAHRRRALLRLTWLRRVRPESAAGTSPPTDDTAQQVRDAVAKLPPRDREVIVLFYLEDLAVARIAELLNVKNNAVEVRLHRARQRLKVLLDGLIGD